MTTPERRFADALAKAREEWAAADAAAGAARAGCELADGGVLVPLFGRPHLVTHPGGEATVGGRRRAGRAGPHRRRHPAAALPADSPTALRRPASGRRTASCRTGSSTRRRSPAGRRRRSRGRSPARRPASTRSAPPRAPPAATRSRWATRRSASSPCRASTSPSSSGPATTRSRARPACSSTPTRATTCRPRTSPASAASSPTGWPRPHGPRPPSGCRRDRLSEALPPILLVNGASPRRGVGGTPLQEARRASRGSHDWGGTDGTKTIHLLGLLPVVATLCLAPVAAARSQGDARREAVLRRHPVRAELDRRAPTAISPLPATPTPTRGCRCRRASSRVASAGAMPPAPRTWAIVRC